MPPVSAISDEKRYKLIEEVRKRAALYDVGLEDYSNKLIKEKLWKEVAEAVGSLTGNLFICNYSEA